MMKFRLLFLIAASVAGLPALNLRVTTRVVEVLKLEGMK